MYRTRAGGIPESRRRPVPEDIKILYPDRQIGESLRANRVEAVVVDLHGSGTVQSLRADLPNGHEVEVRFPEYTYMPLDISVGHTVELCLRPEAMGLLHGLESPSF
ncbi:MAG: TOBE domain-containing protein [Thermoleophilia bacterium]